MVGVLISEVGPCQMWVLSVRSVTHVTIIMYVQEQFAFTEFLSLPGFMVWVP
jgi:hypothetical protein